MKYTRSSQDISFRNLLIDQLNLNQNYEWVLEWIVDEFFPEDVFEKNVLEDWALDNGYVKEEK